MPAYLLWGFPRISHQVGKTLGIKDILLDGWIFIHDLTKKDVTNRHHIVNLEEYEFVLLGILFSNNLGDLRRSGLPTES